MNRTPLLLCVLVAILTGCASYVTPGRGADLGKISPAASAATLTAQHAPEDPIAQSFDKKPMAHFPASVAVVRVQQPGYYSQTAQGWGTGQYSIVTTRDVEKPDQLERLGKLPQLRGIAPINRLLLSSSNLNDDTPLRQAAAKLQADMVLIYTFDTTFKNEDKAIPLSVISLGLSPNQQIRVTSTASALLMDTRNGYLYGLAEATSQQNHLTNAWQSDVAIDETRRDTESKAFEKLVGELEKTWKQVVTTYASAQ